MSLRAASLAPLRSAAIKRHLARQIQSESPSEARASMTTDRGSVRGRSDGPSPPLCRASHARLPGGHRNGVQMQLSRSRISASLCLPTRRNFGDAQVSGVSKYRHLSIMPRRSPHSRRKWARLPRLHDHLPDDKVNPIGEIRLSQSIQLVCELVQFCLGVALFDVSVVAPDSEVHCEQRATRGMASLWWKERSRRISASPQSSSERTLPT